MQALKQLLLVDDEPAILMAYSRLLGGPKVLIDTAGNLEEVTSYLANKSYDVIISDIRLTGTFDAEGFEILRMVKAQNALTQVILVTAFGNPEVKERAFDLGAAIYLEKPVLAVELRKAIQSLGVDI